MKTNTWTWIGIALIVIISGIAGACIKGYFTAKCPQIRSDTVKIPFDTASFVAHLKPIIILEQRDTGTTKWRDNIILLPSNYKPLTAKDTAAILKDYLATNRSSDTIVNDSLLWFRLNSEITQNKLVKADGKYFIKKPAQTINTVHVTNPPVNQLYLGIGGGTDFMNAFKIEGRVTLKNKKDNLWGIKAEKITGIKKVIFSGSYDFKIKF